MTDRKEKKDTTVVTARIDNDLHRKAKEKLPGAENSFQSLFEGWLIEWVEGRRQVPTAIPKLDKNQAWHDMLDEILGDRQERVGIEKNLQWAIDSIRSKKGVVSEPKRKQA